MISLLGCLLLKIPTSPFSHHKSKSHQEQLDELENEDPIWPMEDKFASNNMWTPYGFASSGDRDDTGSTFDTAEDGIQTTQSFRDALQRAAMEQADTMDVRDVVESAQTQSENEDGDGDVAMNVDTDGVDSELEDILRTGQSTISLVPSKPPSNRSESQQSMASGSSSQSQLGFFGQASKFVSSYLGKKKGEPVKSIQLAAAAAKKQQQEADKKASRLKDMEARRQQAMQRKADEEKARAVEEERKIKEDVERRKREREEHTDKRPLRSTKLAEDDTTKKRKITVETQKKPDTQKPPSRDQPSRLAKPTAATTPATKTKTMKSIMKQPSSSQLSSTTPATKEAPRQIKPMSSTTSLKSALKGKGKAQPLDEDMQQPSQQLQSQMVYRAQAHMKATEPRAPPKVAPESIELPEVHSDYEYSDDEPRQDAFEPPEWAQSPELREALKQQSSMNPDAIFGPIQPFRMEELFAAAARQPRLKVRSSSANWGVAGDGLTQEEERDYARRMGFD
ncbi:hypothetical protein QCA50_001864 [Cerrena zonata]|uniref:Inner centromere protein ARK-binding domain-containing protein n=1 Tax=Cerrena zonata TaxID=2478898 RepID=A0AAW0GPJ3_9APHY